MIKFSIITVCLNAGKDVLDTVQNILQQNYDNYELIVKDGFSQDGSLDNLPNDSHIRLIRKKDKSVYDAMNQGITEATGDFCIFINAGDGLYASNTLQQIADFISCNNGDFYYGRSYTIEENVIRFGPKKMTKNFCYRSTVCHQAMVIKTPFLKKRGYDCTFGVSADREWMIYAFIEAQMQFVQIPFIIANYKGGGISVAKNSAALIHEEDKILKVRYFTKMERTLFAFCELITLRCIREFINSNPKFRSMYGRLKYVIVGRKQ